jgi:hypothetical protein
MEGIPEPKSRAGGGSAGGSTNRRTLILGVVAGALFVAAGTLTLVRMRGSTPELPPAAQTADDKLRAELEAKNPPPPPPEEPVEEGEGRRLQR